MSQSNRSLAWGKALYSKQVLANLALILGAAGAAAWFLLGPQSGGTTEDRTSHVVQPSDSPEMLVQLSPTKLATAGIKTQQASIQSLLHTHIVPGRIEYDESRRLQLRLPVECIVKEVLVRTGQQVSEGTQLAVLTSKQIGVARDDVQQCEEDLQLARKQQQWADSVAANVTELLTTLAQSPDIADLEATFKERPIGTHRQELLAAYSDLLLARQFYQGGTELSDKGVLAGRTLQERRNRLERASATFQSVCEETKFQLSVEKQTAEVAVARAERARKISAEQFAALLGPYGTNSRTPDAALNEFVLTAPFAGSIEDRHITTPAAMVAANSPLFTLANTDRLWVSAQIHERNWQAASIARGQTVLVTTPATGDREFTATIAFVGAVVDPATRALPLVAEIDNSDHLLKPGMFVWVSVPVEAERKTLAVPASAVMRHEGEAFVFVADTDNRFHRVNITTGLETEEWVEVRTGLIDGETVAASGAFALKSELLLEREEG